MQNSSTPLYSQGKNSTPDAVVNISPLTLITILDHHTRRSEEYTHSGVVGVLLGAKQHSQLLESSSYSFTSVFSNLEEERNIYVKNSFPLVHSTSEQRGIETNLEF